MSSLNGRRIAGPVSELGGGSIVTKEGQGGSHEGNPSGPCKEQKADLRIQGVPRVSAWATEVGVGHV